MNIEQYKRLQKLQIQILGEYASAIIAVLAFMIAIFVVLTMGNFTGSAIFFSIGMSIIMIIVAVVIGTNISKLVANYGDTQAQVGEE